MRFRLQTVAVCGAAAGIAVFSLYQAVPPSYGPPSPSPWPGVAGAGLLWGMALILLRRKAARLRREGCGAVPRLRGWLLLGILLFEAGMNVPMYFDAWFIIGEANFAMIFLHFGVVVTALLTGISFLISRVPFKKRIYPIVVVMLGAGWFAHICTWGEACASV